jgi:hypothetical protein
MVALIASNGRIVFSVAVGIKAGRTLQRGSLHCRAPRAWHGSSARAIATMVSPRYCLRRLDRADQARRLIQPGWHESSRTFSARHGGVNWKMAGLRARPGTGAARHIDAGNFNPR